MTTAAPAIAASLPPTRRGKATREKLLAAAATVFGRLGYSGTRVADIIAEAGISHGLFYRHYPDKNAILLAVLEELNEDLRRISARSLGEDDAPDLHRLQQRNIQFFADYRRNRLLLRVAREAAAQNEDTGFRAMWLKMRGRFVQRTQHWLERLVGEGAIPPVADIPMLAEGLSALTEQLAYVQIGLADTDPDDAAIERLGQSCGLIWYRAVRGGPG